MNVSIIIPNFNGEKLLRENLPKVLSAIKDYKRGKVEIIITDDVSADNSKEIVENFISSIKDKNIIGKLVRGTYTKDRGFSKNVNRGVSIASGDILVLLNTDVVPYKGFLEPLLKHFNDTKIFAVGCMDESIENGKVVLRGRGVGRWERGFLFHNAGLLDKTNTLWVAGGSGAFRKNTWDRLGGLNELYNPYYWEDIDLSYRAQKSGYKLLFEKESRVVHEHERGSIKSTHKTYDVQKIAYRNQFLFVWLNITDLKLIIYHLIWLPYHLIAAVKDKNKAFISGFILSLKLIPKVLIYRQKMKKMFIKSDAEILSSAAK